MATLVVAYLLPFYLAAMAGVWLFSVQHQFEDAYWARHDDWNYVDASLRGSSHLRMPAVLNWFTGDIDLHHVHHIAPRIPNHRLRGIPGKQFHLSSIARGDAALGHCRPASGAVGTRTVSGSSRSATSSHHRGHRA